MTNVILKVLRINSSKGTLWNFCCIDCCTIAGYFFQRDTIVYPSSRAKPNFLTRRLPKKILSYLPWSKSAEREHPQVDVLQCSLMLETSLNVHLQSFQDILLKGDLNVHVVYSISVSAKRIVDLFILFMSRNVYVTNTFSLGPRLEAWQTPSVSKVCVCMQYSVV